jgi:hypothetical protein
MILSETRLDAFGPFLHSSFLSQVTMGCDPVLSQGAFGVREWEGANPCFLKSR